MLLNVRAEKNMIAVYSFKFRLRNKCFNL